MGGKRPNLVELNTPQFFVSLAHLCIEIHSNRLHDHHLLASTTGTEVNKSLLDERRNVSEITRTKSQLFYLKLTTRMKENLHRSLLGGSQNVTRAGKSDRVVLNTLWDGFVSCLSSMQ